MSLWDQIKQGLKKGLRWFIQASMAVVALVGITAILFAVKIALRVYCKS